MDRSAPLPVVFLPGGVTPVALSYAPLLEELGGESPPLLKDLEVYAGAEPRPTTRIQLEVDALERAADAAAWIRSTSSATRVAARSPSTSPHSIPSA